LKTYIHLVASIDRNIFSNTTFDPTDFPKNTAFGKQLMKYQTYVDKAEIQGMYRLFIEKVIPRDMPCAAQMSGSTKYMEQCQVGTNDLIGPE